MSSWSRVIPSLLALLLASAGLLTPSDARAEEARRVIDDEAYENAADKLTAGLSKEEKLVNYSVLARTVPLIRPGIGLAPAAVRALPPEELAAMLRHSTVAMGLRYQEPRSRKWRFMIGATAFAVAPEILCTSLHVMTIDPSMMREAQAVAVTEDGGVYPVTGIISASGSADTCLIRVPGLNLPALPIRPGVRQGEQVSCMSHPDGFTYMFTSGQVARISRDRLDPKLDPSLHVEVTAEYCPGSSGGAITDAAGNVVAQVSSINNYDGFTSRDGKSVTGIVSARTCTAAEEILAITMAGTNILAQAPKPSPTPRPKRHSPKNPGNR